MTITELQNLLESYVTPERAHILSRATYEDMSSINFDIIRSHFTPPGQWRMMGAQPQAEYALPKNLFDINSDIGSEAMEGSFLTTGNILRLAQCVILGRRYIPDIWPGSFAGRIKSKEHLDALNEIWWLKFWRGIQTVVRGPKVSGDAPDFEWEIRTKVGLSDYVINLEVKRRTGNINKMFKKGRPTASVRKIAHKFKQVDEKTANLAALTIYHPVSPDIESDLRYWLEQQDHVHGLLVWTEGNYGKKSLQRFIKASRGWVNCSVADPEPEDLKIAGNNLGTLCEKKDVPKYLEEMARQLYSNEG